jgi:Flp pilus assembly protein TadG
VEFALICLPFFALLFAIVDYAQIYFYENSLQNAMREASRFGSAGDIIQLTVGGVPQYETNSTGFSVPKAINDSSGREASRDECMKYWFQSNCVIQIPMTNITVVSATYPTGATPLVSTNSAGKLNLLTTNGGTPVAGPGQANDYMQITATYSVNTITPLFSYLGGYSRQGWDSYPIIVTAIVKNEPALLNFQHIAIYGATNANGEQ